MDEWLPIGRASKSMRPGTRVYIQPDRMPQAIHQIENTDKAGVDWVSLYVYAEPFDSRIGFKMDNRHGR